MASNELARNASHLFDKKAFHPTLELELLNLCFYTAAEILHSKVGWLPFYAAFPNSVYNVWIFSGLPMSALRVTNENLLSNKELLWTIEERIKEEWRKHRRK
jgi:hypothetical protein